MLRLLGVGGQTGGHGIHTVEELKDVVRESQDEGVIPYGDEQMLLRAMEFGGRFVREAMIPRTDIVAVEKDATLGELLDIFKTSRHSRFPVYEDDLDHICGIVTMKDVLPLLADDPDAVNRPLTELDDHQARSGRAGEPAHRRSVQRDAPRPQPHGDRD